MTMLYARHLLFYTGLIMKYQILLTHDSHETKSRFSTPASAVLALSDWTLSPVNCTGCILSSKYNCEVHTVMKKILSPLNRSCMKSGCNILWLPMLIPQRNFFLSMLQSIHQRPLPFPLLPSFCLPVKEKMRSIVRIFLLHQFSYALIIPQNICVIAENHLLFPAYPLKC